MGWHAGATEIGGAIGFIRFLASPDTDWLPAIRIAVRVAIKTEDRNGMPNELESGELDDIERDLVQGLDSGVLVGVLTVDGKRDFHLYGASRVGLKEWAQGIQTAHLDHEMEFLVADDPEHSLYKMLQKDAEAAKDRVAIANLLDLGADPTAPRRIEHFTYFATESDAESAAVLLREHDYSVSVTASAAPGNGWLVLAAFDELLQLDRIAHYRAQFDSFAADRGGEYDGWGSPIGT